MRSGLSTRRVYAGVAIALILTVIPGLAVRANASPSDRGYELVSPPEKNGGEVMGDVTKTRAAATGDAVAFVSLSAFADAVGTGVIVDYLSQRSGSGWVTHAMTPRQEPQGFVTVLNDRSSAYVGVFAADLTQGVFEARSPLTDVPNVATTRNLYLRTDMLSPGAGNYVLLTSSLAPVPAVGVSPNTATYKPFIAGSSNDFGHVLFESTLNLTSDASGVRTKLYDWDHGTVKLVGILPNGLPANTGCPSSQPCSVAGRGASTLRYSPGVISDDGSRIVFTSPVATNNLPNASSQVYLRENNATTVRANRSERTDCASDPTCGGDNIADPAPLATQAASYWASSSDGSKVLFTSTEQLTDDDVNTVVDLYVYDAEKPDSAPDNLQRLSVSNNETVYNVRGVLGVSDDASYVYFAAGDGQLVAGEPTSADDGLVERIYVWHDGRVRYVGALPLGGEDLPSAISTTAYSLFRKTARVTPDGQYLVFTARDGAGLTGYDHGEDVCGLAGTVACTEVYVYHYDGNNGAGRLMCASCNPTGASATSDASPALRLGTSNTILSEHLNRSISEDGRHVFFTSGDPLVPEDDNGVNDAYTYDTVTDTISLISTGKDSEPSYFLDASTTGADVFFITRERLVGIDRDQAYDLYDARVGGGMPDQNPPAPQPPCTGEGCQEAATGVPEEQPPGSIGFAGGIDASQAEKLVAELTRVWPVFSVKPLGRRAARRWATTGVGHLSVTMSMPGQVRATAWARIGPRRQAVATTTQVVPRGGTTRLRLRLLPAARKVLREHMLRVTIKVSCSNAPAMHRAVVTLRAPRGAR